MVHLFLAILAIALVSALTVASINYLPWWQQPAAAMTKVLDLSLAQVEAAYQVVARAGDGTGATPRAGGDGGFKEYFLPVLQFTPAAPATFQWSYGREGNLDYFCLSSPQGKSDQALATATWRVLSTRSPDQMKVNTQCGAKTTYTQSAAADGPLAITYWVAYSPDIPR